MDPRAPSAIPDLIDITSSDESGDISEEIVVSQDGEEIVQEESTQEKDPRVTQAIPDLIKAPLSGGLGDTSDKDRVSPVGIKEPAQDELPKYKGLAEYITVNRVLFCVVAAIGTRLLYKRYRVSQQKVDLQNSTAVTSVR